jgi:hypothetical protein
VIPIIQVEVCDSVMTVSTTVKLAKEKGAKLYKEGNFVESIKEYSIAIDNGDSNDNELHLYYRYGRCIIVAVLKRLLEQWVCLYILKTLVPLNSY